MGLRKIFARVLVGLIVLVGVSFASMMLLRFLPYELVANPRELILTIVLFAFYAAAGVSLLYTAHSSRYERLVRSAMWLYLVVLAVYGALLLAAFLVPMDLFFGNLMFLMGVAMSLIGLICLLGYSLLFVRFTGNRLERILEVAFLVSVGIAALRIAFQVESGPFDLVRIFLDPALYYSLLIGLLIWIVRIRGGDENHRSRSK